MRRNTALQEASVEWLGLGGQRRSWGAVQSLRKGLFYDTVCDVWTGTFRGLGWALCGPTVCGCSAAIKIPSRHSLPSRRFRLTSLASLVSHVCMSGLLARGLVAQGSEPKVWKCSSLDCNHPVDDATVETCLPNPVGSSMPSLHSSTQVTHL